MKLFSVEEANELLPRVRPIVKAIQRAHARVMGSQDAARAAAARTDMGGGGMIGGTRYIAALINLAEEAGKLEANGVQMKDYGRGLIDFPHLRDGRIVLLCWQLGEGDTIEWWHEIEAGFAGRQPL